MARRKTHKDVEFVVLEYGGRERFFTTFDEAAAHAAAMALDDGNWHDISVLVHSEAGARWFGGDEAVERYRSDPDASVFERIKLKAQSEGMIP